ncbi:PKD domain-containing protein [Pontiellaceae bacterium B12219]|nr:PKD domain-containing protein [Pontiellaceae bacterium B12219]
MKLTRWIKWCSAALFAMTAMSYGVTYTWTGAVDGNWSNAANWDVNGIPMDTKLDSAGLTLPYTDLIVFDGATAPTNLPGVGGEYDATDIAGWDTPRMEFNSGGTFELTMSGNGGAVWVNNTTTGASNTVFNVGDGIGGSGDVTVSVSGMGSMSRHADNVFNNFQVNSDGVLIFEDAVDFRYNSSKTTRNSKFTINGGELIVKGVLGNLGANDTHVDFISVGGSLTAQYGSTLPDFNAVQTSSVWRNNAGPNSFLEFSDHGDGTNFTVRSDSSAVLAAINVSTNMGVAPLEVTFYATNSTGPIASYDWDFGDGDTGTGSVVTHTFNEVDNYLVTLTVSDGLGTSNSTAVGISATHLTEVFELISDTANSSTPDYGTDQDFLLNDTFDYNPNNPTATLPNSLAYQDGFHGNEAATVDVLISFLLEGSNTYTTAAGNPVIVIDMWGRNSNKDRDENIDVQLFNGSYDASNMVGFVNGVRVDDSSNLGRATINTLPVGTTFDRVRIVGHNSTTRPNNPFTLTEVRMAALYGELQMVTALASADPVSGYYPLDVAFEGTNSYASLGSITEYLWDFGDGNSDSGVQVTSHTYTESGEFTNTLTVINSLGDTNSMEVLISALNPIIPAISVSTNTAYAGVDIDFDGSGSTNEVADALISYLWDFGDGSTASGITATKAFATPGTNTVTLTVEDAAGRSNTVTAVVYTLASPSLSLSGTTLSWSTPDVKAYEVQYTDNLVLGNWDTYTNIISTPPTTSVELPLGRADTEHFKVITQ